MPHFEQLPSGNWRVTVQVGGHRARATTDTPDLRERNSLAATLTLQLEDEIGPMARRTKGHTVAELLSRHMRDAEWAPTYRDEMDRALKRIPEALLNMRVDRVTTFAIEEHLATLKLPASAVGRIHELLGTAFKSAVRWDWCKHNPVYGATKPKAKKRKARKKRAVPVATIRRILAEIDKDPAWAAYVRLAASSGMRRGEMVGLQWGDLDLDGDQPHVDLERAVAYTKRAGVHVKDTKTEIENRIAIGPGTVAALKRLKADKGTSNLILIQPDSYVFGHLEPRRPDWATQRWVRLMDKMGTKGVRLNDLRHSHASILIGEGFDIVMVSERQSHADPNTTLRIYSHALPERDRQAAETIDRMLDG